MTTEQSAVDGRRPRRSRFSPGLFLIGLLTFFMPFVSVSCQNVSTVTLSGATLAAGGKAYQVDSQGQTQGAQPLHSEPFAAIAALCAVAGLAVSLRGGGALVAAATGGVGSLSLLMLRSKINTEVLTHGGGLFEVHFRLGFYLALACLLGAALLNGALVAGRAKDSA